MRRLVRDGMKRSPLNRKRDKPRRNEGRVTSVRVKPRARSAPTASEKAHLDGIAAMGCLVCRAPANVHHVMKAPGKVQRRDHRFVAPLCREHHQGDTGVHGLGSEAKFERAHGIDLAAWAVAEWERSADTAWGLGPADHAQRTTDERT